MLKDFRLLAILPIVAALFFAFAPDSVTNRLMSMFDLNDPTQPRSARDAARPARHGP